MKIAKRKVGKKPPAKKPVLVKPAQPIEQLAARCAVLQAQLMAAGRSLHDQAGPLLSAAGIHLQLLKMDTPKAAGRIQEVSDILEQALANVRHVSQTLAPSPVFRGGLERALGRLAEDVAESAPVDVAVDYEAPAGVSRESAVAIYEAVEAALWAAVRSGRASEVSLTVRHKGTFTAKIEDNGKGSGRAQALEVARLVAGQSGLKLDITTGKSTIVSIRAYALRRAAG